MSVPSIIMQDAVYNAIGLRKLANGFTNNDFNLDWSYLPRQRLADFNAENPNGKVYVIALAFEEGIKKSRENMTMQDIPIQIGIQKYIPDLDRTKIRNMVILVQELYDLVRKDVNVDGYDWMRTIPLKDQNDTPFNFAGLREKGFFESYFTAYYQTPLE